MKHQRFFCETCQVELAHLRIHNRGVRHRQAKRLQALLSQNCMTFSEIGKRVGLSRERVRQIAKSMPGIDAGFKRMKICTFNRLESEFEDHPVLGQIKELAAAHAVQVQPVIMRQGCHQVIAKRQILASGVLCSVRGGSMYGRTVRISQRSIDPRIPFVIVYVQHGPTMVIPSSRYPANGIGFVLESKRGYHKPEYTRKHDWIGYIDAWHLIKDYATLRQKDGEAT